jgi:hypothetical protein
VPHSIPTSEEEVIAACEFALGLAPSEWLPNLPAHGGPLASLGLPQLHPFENEAWAIGESIRQAFVQFPKLKKKAALIGKVVEVATHRNLRRGRQSFVMAIGFVAAHQFSGELVPLLDDSDVNGQVVYTLLKMKATGYARAVSALLQSEEAWKRRLARKYVERYPRGGTMLLS